MSVIDPGPWDALVRRKEGRTPPLPLRLVACVKVPGGPDVLGVGYLGEWWEESRDKLDWQPIDSYVKITGSAAYVAPFVLRDGDDWTYGCWADGKWRRWTETYTVELEGFEPTQWADVSLDDAILLGQE